MKKYLICLLVGLFSTTFALYSRENPTGFAPLFFGPNALQIPDLLDGRTKSHLEAHVAGDAFYHYNNKDWTSDIFLQLHIPLFTERVNLTLWMPALEWHKSVPEPYAGDVYISTDMMVVKEYRFCPSFTLRSMLKTASGEHTDMKRFYDSPGYCFDLSTGKSFYFNKGYLHYEDRQNANVELRLSGTIGFLCWQTKEAAQNDAVYYGLQISLYSKHLQLTQNWSGYYGWEDYGDQPMAIKTKIGFPIKAFQPYFYYQYGLKDYPFHQFRVGLSYQWDILKKVNKG